MASTPNVAGTAVGAATSAANVASTAVSASPMRIVAVQPGPADSTLTLENTSGTPVDLTNWSVRLGATSLRLPANTVVPPNGRLVVHSGTGTSTASDVYLAQDTATLLTALQSGTTVSLVDASGNVVGEMTPPR